MQYPLYSTLKTGRDYCKQWPLKGELNAIFPENKIISLTVMASRFLPALAVITATVQYALLEAAFLPQILAMMLFIATLPLQGLYWLGIRASTVLQPEHARWFNHISQQMQQHGIELPVLKQAGRYVDLARVLQVAYQQLDKTFIREWL